MSRYDLDALKIAAERAEQKALAARHRFETALAGPDISTLGGRVLDARRRACMTGEALAARVECTRSFVSMVETGRAKPALDDIPAWASALYVTAEWLAWGHGQTEPVPTMPAETF